MSILVGHVISVRGVKISVRVFEESNKDTIFYDGVKYKGISIREHVQIERGFYRIICIVEGEYLDEKIIDGDEKHVRVVDLKPIGYFENNTFIEGVKHLPLIKDPVYLLQESRLSDVYGSSDSDFVIGKLLKEGLSVSLPWKNIFNSHIGIFGNTGSGKSNTLAKVITTLLDNKIERIVGKSRFVVLDFNGEYTSSQFSHDSYKKVYRLNSRCLEDKFPISSGEIWDSDTLSLLFKATKNTQKPFIDRVIQGKSRYQSLTSFQNYIRSTFEKVFTASSPNPELINLIREVALELELFDLFEVLRNISYHGVAKKFWGGGQDYYESNGECYSRVIKSYVDKIVVDDGFNEFDEFRVRCNLQLIRDLISGFVQFDFILPLIKRIESSSESLKRVVEVVDDPDYENVVTVVSLRKCNQDIKKVIPLLIAKNYYNPHKISVSNPPDKTIHLVIDEAHNILSQQSHRESESWKDYRLETFEEIIKEGRKFGVYLTLSSQRPADISPTIVSQMHNFFIHRLVNDRDLLLIDNTISSLDSMSRSMIPNLSRGCCVVTGTAFDLPMLLQIDELHKNQKPDSDDVDLDSLWAD